MQANSNSVYSYVHTSSPYSLLFQLLVITSPRSGYGFLPLVSRMSVKVCCPCMLVELFKYTNFAGIIMGFPTTLSMNLVCSDTLLTNPCCNWLTHSYYRACLWGGPSCLPFPKSLGGHQVLSAICQTVHEAGFSGYPLVLCVQTALSRCFLWPLNI